jgi:hypothetical protein
VSEKLLAEERKKKKKNNKNNNKKKKKKPIVNVASDITYRPVIEADDTGRCTEYMNFNLLLF